MFVQRRRGLLRGVANLVPSMSADAEADRAPSPAEIWRKVGLHLFHVRFTVNEFARRDPSGGAPVRLGDVVLDILASNPPEAPASDLKGAKFPGLDEAADKALLDVELFGSLLDGQEAALGGFIGHGDILCAALIPGVHRLDPMRAGLGFSVPTFSFSSRLLRRQETEIFTTTDLFQDFLLMS